MRRTILALCSLPLIAAAGCTATRTAAKPPATATTSPAASPTASPSSGTPIPSLPGAPAPAPSTSTVTPSQVPSGFTPDPKNVTTFTDFTAISATQWWLLGSAPCSVGTCPAIVETSDGGASWHTVPAPGPAYAQNGPPTGGQVTKLRFATAMDGWAFGPGLYATTDGGRDWKPIDLGGSVNSLEPGLGKVYAAVDPAPSPTCNPAAPTSCSGAQLWTSPVGTIAWTRDAAAPSLSDLLAVHGANVYLQAGSGGSIGQGVLISRDAGATFTANPSVGFGLACRLSPVSDQVVWGFCITGMQGQGLISTDAGKTFTPVNIGPQRPNSSQLVGASALVAVAAFPGIVAGPIERTTDGGRTFAAVQQPPSQSGEWVLLGFTNPEDGYAFWTDTSSSGSENSSLWHTTDAGAHWRQVAVKS